MKQLFFLIFSLIGIQLYAANDAGLSSLLKKQSLPNEYIVQRSSLKSTPFLTVQEWHRLAQEREPLSPMTSITSFEGYCYYLRQYINQQKRLLSNTPWLNTPVDFNSPLLAQGATPDYMRPFVMKFSAPAGSICYFWGDLHGDIQALSNSLYKLYKDGVIDNNFYILKPNCSFFFLGDIVDRGQHCIDTLTLIFFFALQNPGKVFLIRGNHEAISMNKKPYYQQDPSLNHFYMQLKKFYDTQDQAAVKNSFEELIDTVVLFYNTLPVAAFVGCNNNYFQCCHGGLEVRYNPQELLQTPQSLCLQAIENLSVSWINDETFKSLQINPACEKYFIDLAQAQIKPFDLGFLWNDFNGDPLESEKTDCQKSRGFIMGKLFTQEILKKYSNKASVKGVIRAHQHNNTMAGIMTPVNQGVYTIWNNQVITTIATSAFNKTTSFIKLTLQNDFKAWVLKSYNLNPVYSDWLVKEKTLSRWRNNLVK